MEVARVVPVDRPPAGKEQDLRILRMCIEYAYRTEADSARYYHHIMSTPLRRNREFTLFLSRWLDDEMRHANILAGLLSSGLFHDIPSGEWDTSHSRPFLAYFTSALFAASWLAPGTVAGLVLSGAVVNELSAFLGYARMARFYPDRSLRHVLGQIAGDERRHAQHFAFFARAILSRSPRATRLVGYYLSTLWRPVGANSNPRQAWPQVAALLFGIDAGQQKPGQLDRLSSALLGIPLEPSVTAARRMKGHAAFGGVA